MRTIAGALAALCLTTGALASCSDSSEPALTATGSTTFTSTISGPAGLALPDVAAVAPAVAALEAELGAPQEYFEINADSQVVNLFVAVPGAPGAPVKAVSYSYVGGTLSPAPTDLGGAEGSTFAASALRFDPSTILNGARDVLPATNLARFVVIGSGDGAVQYGIDGVSASGGQLRVVVAADGSVVEITPVS